MTTNNHLSPLAAAALEYTREGFMVFPLKADKSPLISQYTATTDEDQVRSWWTQWPDALIGCRVQEDEIILDVDPKANGMATAMALRQEFGRWAATRVHLSGRGDGGGHLWFKRPDVVGTLSTRPLDGWAQEHGTGRAITDKDGNVTGWTCGIDLIHYKWRYTILPPSPHPTTGEPYTWSSGQDAELGPVPEWLAAMLGYTPPAKVKREHVDRNGTSLLDWYSDTADWCDLLIPEGWELVDGDGNEEGSTWKHPTATSAQSAAIKFHQLFVFSPNTVFEMTGGGDTHGYTPFAAYALLHHGGDMSAAAEAVGRLLQPVENLVDPPTQRESKSAARSGEPAVSNGDQSDAPSPEYFFTAKGAIIPARLGWHIVTNSDLRLGTDGRIYRYQDGFYHREGDMWVKRTVQELVGEKFRKHHHDEVLAWLRPMLDTIPERPPTRYLNVANGIIDLDTGELLDHDPKIPSTIRIPVMWNPDATCPRVDQFLADVLPDDTVDLMIELIGYALYTANPLAKAVLLLGPAGNGKSKLLMLIRALLGDANVSSIPLQTLSENRFAAAQIYGKLANICGDLDARSIKRSDLFKQITGGDVIMAEHKYGHPFNFTSFALPIFSANEAPLSSDQTEAWFDRWLIVPMEARFRGTDREDPFIERKITAPNELEGLLVKTVEALRTLLSRGKFLVPRSVQAAGEGYRDRLDSVRAFVSEECIIDLLHPNLWTSRSALYQGYRRWAQNSGRQSLSNASFNARLRQDFKLEEKGRRGQRGWGGISYGLVSERVEAA